MSIPLVVTGVAVLTDYVLGNHAAAVPLMEELSAPVDLMVMATFLLVFGPLPEELSWRGLGLPLLRGSHGALASTLVLAGVWVVWHLPLFWLEGSYQFELGILTPDFWLYMAAAFATTFLFRYFVAIDDQTKLPVAMAMVSGNSINGISIGGIGVLPTHKGNGVGKRLIGKCVDVAREEGYRAIDAVVFANNFRMLKLLIGMEFQPINMECHRGCDGSDLLYLKKYLS